MKDKPGVHPVDYRKFKSLDRALREWILFITIMAPEDLARS